jgi:hypothetical protein
MKKIIYVDIDETICLTPLEGVRDYTKSIPIKENIEKINNLYEQGNIIIYWTARGSRSKIDWYNLTENQLNQWGAKYHKLRCDKPFYDLFIEDKSIKIEDLN